MVNKKNIILAIAFTLMMSVTYVSAQTPRQQPNYNKPIQNENGEIAQYEITAGNEQIYITTYEYITESCILIENKTTLCGTFKIDPLSKISSYYNNIPVIKPTKTPPETPPETQNVPE